MAKPQLNEMSAVVETEGFKASSLAKWFHYSLHRDFQLDSTTTIFTPNNRSYNESLFMLAIGIAFFGLLLFIILLGFYTCCFCLSRKPTRPLSRQTYEARKKCFRRLIFAMGFIVCVAIILGFVFNSQTSNGVDDFRNTVTAIHDDLTDAFKLGSNLDRNLDDAYNLMSGLPNVQTAMARTNNMRIVLWDSNRLIPVNIGNGGGDFGDDVHHYDNYRWLVTVTLLSWSLFLCIFCLWILCQTTGCVLSMLTIFAFSSMILTWVVMAAHFGIATGTGDFCVNPEATIKNMTDRNDLLQTVVVDYYLKCSKTQYNPFMNVNNFQRNLSVVMETIQKIHDAYPEYEQRTATILLKLQTVQDHLPTYQEEYLCGKVHKEYLEAMDSLCNKTLVGVAVVILSLLIVAIFAGLLTCCICPLCGYRKTYDLTYQINAQGDVAQRDVLWWPEGLQNNYFDNDQQYQPHSEQTPLLHQQQSPSHFQTVNHAAQTNSPNQITTTFETQEYRHSF